MTKYKTYAYARIKINEHVSDGDVAKAAVVIAEMDDRLGLSKVKQPDLLYMDDILVSVGENLNEDIFLPNELLAAIIERDTVPLKPVNWEHNESDIIGVMYDSAIIDKQGNKIEASKMKAEDLTDFDVLSRSVIWKIQHPEKALQIIQGSQDGTLFVSMEAWFDNYDYAVGNQIIQRNESTSFLDNSLKAHGGTGEFEGHRVRRVLREITFAGKGIVKRPANKDSIITLVANTSPENQKEMVLQHVLGTVSGKKEEKLIFGTEEVIETPTEPNENIPGKSSDVKTGENRMDEKLKEMEAKLDAAQATIKKLESKLGDKNIAEADNKIKKLEEENTELIKKCDEMTEKMVELDKSKADLEEATKAVEESKEKIEKLEAEVKSFVDEKRLVDRQKEILEIAKLEGDDLNETLAEVKSLSDEDFESYKAKMKRFAPKMETEAGSEANTDVVDPKADADADPKKTEDDISKVLDDVNPENAGTVNADEKNDHESMVDVFQEIFAGKKEE